MIFQRSLLAALPGWLVAAGLSIAAHVGVFAWLPHAGTVGPAPRPEVATAMHVRVVAEEPSKSLEESVFATSVAQPELKSTTEERAAARRGAVSAVRDLGPNERTPADPWHAFLPSRALDVSPLPRSSPDLSVLTGVSSSGLPLRLRLFVDDHGHVVEVLATQVSPGDEEVAGRLREMFLETLFLPGKLHGADVASYMDLEFAITEAK